LYFIYRYCKIQQYALLAIINVVEYTCLK